MNSYQEMLEWMTLDILQIYEYEILHMKYYVVKKSFA